MNTRNGRSDRIRTCGIDVPNVARYQLRHTPKCVKYSILGQFCKWSNLWSGLFLRGFFVFLNVRKTQHLQGFLAFLLLVELGVGHTLPNVARYQLRHTPMCEKY